LDEIVKLCENAKDVFIPSACDLNLEHKWVSNYILKKAQFKEGTSVYLYSYNYLFPTLNGKVLPTIAVPVDVERKKQLVEKYYPSQYPSLRDCGLLDGLKNFEEFAIWKRGI